MITRREFIKKSASGASLLALSSVLGGCFSERFLQNHFKKMSKEELDLAIRRMENEYKYTFSREVKIKTTSARPNVLFGMAIDLSKCIGCRQCVYACIKENNACVGACPTGARKFGNILDKESVIRKILAEKNVFVLKPESNTQSNFYYYFG